MAASAFIPASFSTPAQEIEILSIYAAPMMNSRPMLVAREFDGGEALPFLRLSADGSTDWVASPLHASRFSRSDAAAVTDALVVAVPEWTGFSFSARSFRTSCEAQIEKLSA